MIGGSKPSHFCRIAAGTSLAPALTVRAFTLLALMLTASAASADHGRVRVRHGDVTRTLALDSVLGAGGVGVVYRAHDIAHPAQRFAVKVLRPQHIGNPHFDTLATEHRVLAAMAEHDLGFPKSFGPGEMVGAPTRAPAFAMEMMPGRPLGGAGPGRGWDKPLHLAPGKAVRVARRLLDQLSALHASGYVHGDVHTGNTSINAELHSWTATLLDFGTSAPHTAQGAKDDVINASRVLLATLTGKRFDDPSALVDAESFHAAVSGRRITLGSILARAEAGGYATAAELHDALEPFAPMAP